MWVVKLGFLNLRVLGGNGSFPSPVSRLCSPRCSPLCTPERSVGRSPRPPSLGASLLLPSLGDPVVKARNQVSCWE